MENFNESSSGVDEGGVDAAVVEQAVEQKPKAKRTRTSKPKRDETPTEVYMVRGFFPPDGGAKMPAGTFQTVPAWMALKLASRGITQDPDMARAEIEEGKAGAVLKYERGQFALQRVNLDAPEPQGTWLDD